MTDPWQELFFKVALAMNCLPSSFIDGNEHVFKAIEAARATPADHSRDDTIEDCAKVCDAMANQVEDERQFALDLCSDAIRALKSQQDAAIESKPAEQSDPIPGSPAYSLRGLYVPVDKYFVDGKPVTPDEYIAWQSQRIETITKSKVPDPKYYGGSAEEGDQHDVKCAYVDGWNDCRGSVLATRDATPADHSRDSVIEECAKVIEPKAPRPCDCDVCDCGNSGDMRAVAWWDEAKANADAIRALKSQQDAAIPFRPWYEILDELKTNPKLLADIEQAVAASKQSIACLERERAVTREQLNTPLDASGSIESQQSGNGE